MKCHCALSRSAPLSSVHTREPPPEPPPPARASAPTSAETKAAWSGFMKQSRAAQSAKKIAKPRGPVPSDEFGLKQWGDIKGEWQSSGPADDAAAGTDSAAESDGDGAGASTDGASSAKRKLTRPPRAFQATWKELLTPLVCISILVAGAKCAVTGAPNATCENWPLFVRHQSGANKTRLSF